MAIFALLLHFGPKMYSCLNVSTVLKNYTSDQIIDTCQQTTIQLMHVCV